MVSKISQEALSLGLISQKQYDNLPMKLLDAISKKKIEEHNKSKPKKKPVKKKKKWKH